MPHAFVHLYPELAAAIGDSLVLTTNERLRRNLVRAYNDAQIVAGRSVWPTPRVQTLNAYLGILYQAHRSATPGLPLLLGAEPEYQLFRATAPEGASDLSVLAQQAWNLCHQWEIPLDHRAFSESENGQTFSGWCERVRRRLSALNAITRAELPAVPGLTSPESVLTCLAFEQLPSALQEWLEKQTAERIPLSPRSPADRVQQAHRTSFASPREELAAVAQWARQTLEADPPLNAQVTFDADHGATGWNAPDVAPWLEASLNRASQAAFGKDAMYMGEGGTIPFMAMLGESFPDAQFVITGVLGPKSNAHGPNEFLHIPYAKKLTTCVAQVLADHFTRDTTA